eukprot:1153109-Pelagomonas_calceolata.AAC.4
MDGSGAIDHGKRWGHAQLAVPKIVGVYTKGERGGSCGKACEMEGTGSGARTLAFATDCWCVHEKGGEQGRERWMSLVLLECEQKAWTIAMDMHVGLMGKRLCR